MEHAVPCSYGRYGHIEDQERDRRARGGTCRNHLNSKMEGNGFMLLKFKINGVIIMIMAVALSIFLIFLSSQSVYADDNGKSEEELVTDTDIEPETSRREAWQEEEAYRAREQYLKDIRLEEAYAARVEYSNERAVSLVSELLDTGSEIVQYALSWVGVTPYAPAGGSLWSGTDCSGFVHLIYEQFGYNLPSGSDAYQYSVGQQISYEELKPGDIIVYGYGAHVGIYAGNNMVVHCSSPSVGTVVYEMFYREPTAYVRVVE